jgi:hypothetical protein
MMKHDLMVLELFYIFYRAGGIYSAAMRMVACF